MIKVNSFILFIITVYSLPAQTDWMATNSRDTFDNLALHSKGDTLFASIAAITAGIHITSDDGTTWLQKNNGITNRQILTFASNQQYIFAGTSSSSNGGVFRSENNGESWERAVNGLVTPIDVYKLVFKGDTLFAATGRGIFYSINNGTNWVKAIPIHNQRISAIAVKDSLIIGAFPGKIFRSGDNGTTWEEINTGIRFEISDIISFKNTLFMSSTGDTLFRSDDAGKTWQRVQTNLPGNIRCLLAMDSLLFVGAEFDGVFKSSDGGITWESYSEGLPEVPILSLAKHKNFLFAGTSTKKIWRLALTETSAVQKVTPLNLHITLYPNPTNQFATLQYNLKEKSFITIALSDVNGRIIKQLLKSTQDAGKQEFTFSVKELIPGNYFCTLSVNSQIASIPLTILR